VCLYDYRQFVGTDHIVNSGFLEVAEQNGIVMLFPQVVTSAENDIGCWDTYGFTSPLYGTLSVISIYFLVLKVLLKVDT